MSKCMYCPSELPEGAVFCPACGKKQVQIYRQTFSRGNMTEDAFIGMINQWFANYPQVANVKGSFELGDSFGLMVNGYILNSFSIEYELLQGNNTYQYGVVNLNNFDLCKMTTKDLLANWKRFYPGAIVLKTNGGVHQRGHVGSLLLDGVGASNKTQLYVFFKYNRQYGPSQLPPPKPQ